MLKAIPSPKVALVYDRVNTPYGGAENVLQSLHHLFPDAPLFTSVYDSDRVGWAKSFQVVPSFVQQLPRAKTHHREYVGLMPLAFESFELDQYDLIISVTSAEAKGVLTKPHQLHLCYLLTPTRYLWSHEAEYQQSGVLELIQRPLFRYLKWWDQAAAKRPDIYIPISQLVAERCQTYYQRPTEPVIYPPVDFPVDAGETDELPPPLKAANITANDYYLVVARLVGYKKIDLAIAACAELGRNLVIIGDGPELTRLEQLSQRSQLRSSQAKTLFLHAVQSNQLTAYYKNCRAFLAPGEEDFGIAALETHLFGKPAILHPRSGAAEVSPDGVSSTHLVDQSLDAVKHAIEITEQRRWSASAIKAQVAQYRTAAFEQQFGDRVKTLWSNFYQQLVTA